MKFMVAQGFLAYGWYQVYAMQLQICTVCTSLSSDFLLTSQPHASWLPLSILIRYLPLQMPPFAEFPQNPSLHFSQFSPLVLFWQASQMETFTHELWPLHWQAEYAYQSINGGWKISVNSTHLDKFRKTTFHAFLLHCIPHRGWCSWEQRSHLHCTHQDLCLIHHYTNHSEDHSDIHYMYCSCYSSLNNSNPATPTQDIDHGCSRRDRYR